MKVPDIVNVFRDVQKELTNEQAKSLLQRGLYAVTHQIGVGDDLLKSFLSTTTETTLTTGACTVTIDRNLWSLASRASIKTTEDVTKELDIINPSEVGVRADLPADYVVLSGDTLDFTDAFDAGYGTIAVVTTVRQPTLFWHNALWVSPNANPTTLIGSVTSLTVYRPGDRQWTVNELAKSLVRLYVNSHRAYDFEITTNESAVKPAIGLKSGSLQTVGVNFTDFTTMADIGSPSVTLYPAEAWYIPLPVDYHQDLVDWCVAELRHEPVPQSRGRSLSRVKLRSAY